MKKIDSFFLSILKRIERRVKFDLFKVLPILEWTIEPNERPIANSIQHPKSRFFEI